MEGGFNFLGKRVFVKIINDCDNLQVPASLVESLSRRWKKQATSAPVRINIFSERSFLIWNILWLKEIPTSDDDTRDCCSSSVSHFVSSTFLVETSLSPDSSVDGSECSPIARVTLFASSSSELLLSPTSSLPPSILRNMKNEYLSRIFRKFRLHVLWMLWGRRRFDVECGRGSRNNSTLTVVTALCCPNFTLLPLIFVWVNLTRTYPNRLLSR